jgi:hypothetical protein
VFGAVWHHDGAAKGPKPIGFGNCWVVAGIVVQLPFLSRPVCLPVLARLWRPRHTGKIAHAMSTPAGRAADHPADPDLSPQVARRPARDTYGLFDHRAPATETDIIDKDPRMQPTNPRGPPQCTARMAAPTVRFTTTGNRRPTRTDVPRRSRPSTRRRPPTRLARQDPRGDRGVRTGVGLLTSCPWSSVKRCAGGQRVVDSGR